jgi:hypothetical protein
MMPEGLFAKLGGAGALAAVLLTIGGWTYDIKRDSEQVVEVKQEIKELQEFKERTDRRLCLILRELGKKDTGCYR